MGLHQSVTNLFPRFVPSTEHPNIYTVLYSLFIFSHRSQDSSVGIVASLRTVQPRNRGYSTLCIFHAAV